AYPPAAITVAGHPAAVELARAAGLADATLAADSPILTPLFASAPPSDVAVPIPTTAVLWAGSSAAPLAAGLRALGAERVLHAPSQPPADCRQHVADHLVQSLAALGVSGRCPAVPRLRPDAGLVAEASAFLARERDAGQGWLAIHPGSGSPRKNWDSSRFAAAAEALAARGLRPLLLAGPAEAAGSDGLLETFGRARPLVVRQWSLPRLAALLSLCAAYVGGDSGITHLAAA